MKFLMFGFGAVFLICSALIVFELNHTLDKNQEIDTETVTNTEISIEKGNEVLSLLSNNLVSGVNRIGILGIISAICLVGFFITHHQEYGY